MQRQGAGWYRFTGAAGERMADYPPGAEKCGTFWTGWLDGGHPGPEDGEVTRTVYFGQRTINVKVINCSGDYFVYNLVDTPDCSMGYCGQ